MKQTLKQVSRLFTSSLGYLTFLEIIYKAIGAVVWFPLCEVLLHLALRFSNVYYISSQNARTALTDPLILFALFVIFLLLALFQGFETQCLAISYQQAFYKKKIGWFQLAKAGFLRTLELLKPRNWAMFPMLVLMFPSLLYFIQNSTNNYLDLIDTLVRSAFRQFPMNVLAGVVMVSILILAVVGMFSFQIHISEKVSGFQSIKKSLQLFKQHWVRILVGLVIWELMVGAVLLILNLSVYGAIRFGVRLLAKASVRKAVTLTISHYAGLVLNFINYSFFTFAGYAFAASYYYQTVAPEVHLKATPLIRFKDPKAHKQGRFTIGMLLLAVLLTFLVNVLMLYTVRRTGLSNALFSEKTAVIAHRGYTTNYRENTLGAIQDGIDAQADLVEIDVQFTKDGVVCVHHDKTLRRCWGINKPVSALTAAELSALTDDEGQHLPMFSEVLELCKDQNITILVELKVNAYNKADELAKATMDVIQAYEMEDQCIIQSFSYNALKTIKNIDENMYCGYLMRGSIGMFYDLEYADFFSMNISYVTRNIVSTIHLRNKTIVVWTVNREDTFQKSVDLNVDGVITDKPIEAREFIYGDSILETILPESDEGSEEF